MHKENIIRLNKNSYILDLENLTNILDEGLDFNKYSISNYEVDDIKNIITPIILVGETEGATNYLCIKRILFRCEAEKKRIENIWGNNDKFKCSLVEYGKLKLDELLTRNYVTDYKISEMEEGIMVEVDLLYNIKEDIQLDIKVEDKLGNVINIPKWAIKIGESESKLPRVKNYNIQVYAIDDNSYKLKVYLNDKVSIDEYVQKLRSK